MPPVLDDDLLILATERVVVPSFPATTGSIEIRLDSRRMERRRAHESSTSDERRRRDRRSLDVTNQLRSVGWAFIPAAHRRASSSTPLKGAMSLLPGDIAQDSSIVRQRLGAALLCAPCIARTCGIPLHRVEFTIDDLQRSAEIRVLGARCEECRKTTLVYALGRH